jgi:hypothetical protein
MVRYGKKSQDKVERAMHEMKRGELKSGRSGKKVTNPKQAVAIGLSEAREEGAKVPRQIIQREERVQGVAKKAVHIGVRKQLNNENFLSPAISSHSEAKGFSRNLFFREIL